MAEWAWTWAPRLKVLRASAGSNWAEYTRTGARRAWSVASLASLGALDGAALELVAAGLPRIPMRWTAIDGWKAQPLWDTAQYRAFEHLLSRHDLEDADVGAVLWATSTLTEALGRDAQQFGEAPDPHRIETWSRPVMRIRELWQARRYRRLRSLGKRAPALGIEPGPIAWAVAVLAEAYGRPG